MSSREPVMTRSRSAKEAAQPTTEPKDDSKQPEMKPTRRSRRLLERRPKQDEDTGAASPAAAPLDTAAPPPLKPLRRAAAGRRASERPVKRQRCDPQLTGLWDLLPTELLDMIIEKCGPRQLACLETTCNYFRNVKKLDNVCYERLKLIPRAKGMEPNRMWVVWEPEMVGVCMHVVFNRLVCLCGCMCVCVCVSVRACMHIHAVPSNLHVYTVGTHGGGLHAAFVAWNTAAKPHQFESHPCSLTQPKKGKCIRI